jgi:hypothetical protein
MIKKKSLLLVAAGALLFLIAQAQSVEAAHCYCRFVAALEFNIPISNVGAYPGQGGEVVLQLEKDGYNQITEKGKCKSYCKGQWDAQDKMALAKKYSGAPGACGRVGLVVFAAIGTAAYERVNTGVFDVGGVLQMICPSGWWSSPDGRECHTGAGCRVPGIPDQDLKGDYFFWKGDLYKRAKFIGWTCKR